MPKTAPFNCQVLGSWLNMPVVLNLFAHYGLDTSDYFGDLIYMAGAYMDENHFTQKSEDVLIKAAGKAMKPLQTALFLQTGG